MAKPKLALIPAAQGTKFYSVLPSDGVGDFDFTRASAATRVNKDGLIETVASGQSRLNYPLIDGVVNGCPSHLLEPARTNSLLQSNQFDTTWTTSNATVTSGQIGVGGSIDAWKIEKTDVNGYIRHIGISVTNGSVSVFAKKGVSNWLRLGTSSGNIETYFDLENGIIGNKGIFVDTSKIVDMGDGWYRCSFSYTGTATGVYLYPADNNGDTSQTSGSVYLQYCQIEAGSYETSYIPTSGSATTRSVETANNSGDASTFNDSEGVIFAELSALANDGTIRRIAIPNSSTAGLHRIELSSTDNRVFGVTYVSPSNQAVISYTMPDATTPFKIAYKYKENSFSLWVDGFERGSDSSGSVPTGLVKMNFDNGAGGSDFYGNTKQLQYFDTTDIDLETLTSWTSFSEMAEGQLYTIE